jgi:hypothetical protein
VAAMVANKFSNRLVDNIPNEDCYTIKDVADELGLSVMRSRQIIDIVWRNNLIPKLIKKEGRTILYSPDFMGKLKDMYLSGKFGKARKRNDLDKSMEKNAQFVIKVPIYDKQVADILTKKLGGEREIQQYLRDKLDEVSKPALTKIEQLKQRHAQELQAALDNN